MRFLDEKDAREEIRRGLKTAKRADLAVAFWGDGAIEELDLGARSGKMRIICNLATGGTNPKVVTDLREITAQPTHDLKVRQNDRLHAKVYLFDDFAVVGSSNASTNGLAFEGSELTCWTEANILVDDANTLASLRSWMSRLGRRPISGEDLKRAKAAWKARRAVVRLPRDESRTVLQALRFEPKTLAELDIYVAVYDEGLSKAGQRTQAQIRKEWGTNAVGIFEDWKSLPARGLLICFLLSRDRLAPEGVWERRGRADDRPKAAGSASVEVAWAVDNVFGKEAVAKGELESWRSICAAIMKQRPKSSSGGVCLPLLNLVKLNLLPDEMRGDSLETDVWRSIRELEAVRTSESGKTVRLGRTHQKIARGDEAQTVTDLVMAKTASRGFGMLIERGMANRTFEAVALRHPGRFGPPVLKAAEERLRAAGLQQDVYMQP